MSEGERFSPFFKKLREDAVEIATDYPKVAECDPWEQLYAIKSSYQGTKAANDDLHRVIRLLLKELGWSIERYLAFCKEHRKETEHDRTH